MIINSVTIKNFRCYKDTINLNFNHNGKVTLIWGDSGYGKSSFIHFLRWMFYGDVNFGKNDDKPLYNLVSFEQSKVGDLLEVYGKIEFEHNSIKYSLTRSVVFKCGITQKLTMVDNSEVVLQHLVDDNWCRFTDAVDTKINSLIPKELSKYFFLYGEQAREIVLDSVGLKKAIHQLFGITAYEKAIYHIGKDINRNSVLGYYSIERASKIPHGINNVNPQQIQAESQAAYDKLMSTEKLIETHKENLKKLQSRQKEILLTLGEKSNQESLNQLIKANKSIIEGYEKDIDSNTLKIGDVLYKNYPYLLLATKTAECSAILREKNKEFSSSMKVFNSLNKNILKEVLEHKACICGRDLDSSSEKVIRNTMGSMPPDSYTYQFNQFVSKNHDYLSQCITDSYEYHEIIGEISNLEIMIQQKSQENEDILKDLQKIESMKELVEELQTVEKEIASINKALTPLESAKYVLKQGLDRYTSQLQNIAKSSAATATIDQKINVFKKILYELIYEKKSQEIKVKTVLNDCVRDVYSRLSTQKEDASKISFIKDDFSLRETYLTGGQLAVDQYSYVIGIVKALKECDLSYKENSIVVDAPFAITDSIQSSHIFETLPLISEQSILLTLDINKISDPLLNNAGSYDFYMIKTKNQKDATIVKGNLDDIKQILTRRVV